MIVIERATDLTVWLNVPVTLTRTLDGHTASFRGVFTDLWHGADNERPEFRRDEAGGHLEYREDGRARSTALCVPYGSTISLAEVTA